MEMEPLTSEALESAGYDTASRTLRVQFRNGGLYDYLDVPREVFALLLAAEHPWSLWQEHITSTYEYRRLE
ncbi:KTSC domain-containing protein [Aeromicrobium flavum]|uniref:KTSC domain-containing protein n=1 Tax=Aeromicrobium flavum TaxID=416568 RepID=UPI0031E3E1A1